MPLRPRGEELQADVQSILVALTTAIGAVFVLYTVIREVRQKYRRNQRDDIMESTDMQ